MKTLYVNYTPIPAQVPRQLAIDILHSHSEVITLNPLVLDHHPIKPPRDAPNDEYYSTWYEIIQRISFIPGIGKLGTSKISFKGCFHDMPWGIQTHTYIPMGIELRHKWQVRGNQPGEAPEPRELGSQAPSTGLYLQENVEIQCNPLSISFVKKELKAASKVMVDRMMKKAELLDAGVLQAMFEDGKLKTVNPNDRSIDNNVRSPSPRFSGGQWRRPESTISASSQMSPSQHSTTTSVDGHLAPGPVEMMGDTHFHVHPAQRQEKPPSMHNELYGDSPAPNQATRWSFSSKGSRTNESSRHSSYYPSPNSEQPNQPVELMSKQTMLSPSMTANTTSPPLGMHQQPYNPQDYARYSGHRHG